MRAGNTRLRDLGAYPFARLRRLLDGIAPPDSDGVIDLTVGEPKRAAPALLTETLAAQADQWHRYAPIAGTDAFRAAAAGWLNRRFDLPDGMIDPQGMVLPLAGTREGLFMAAQLAVSPLPRDDPQAVLVPDPGYAVYEGAAVMAGARPVAVPATAESGFLPELGALLRQARRCEACLIYLCSPSNPQGVAADRPYLRAVLDQARALGAILVVDECYTDLYHSAPPAGALEAAADSGSLDNLLVFHSLSKRSNAAGMRSGFVVGDPALIADFVQLRSFAAAGSPYPVLAAAAALWRDDAHAAGNRAFYADLFDRAARVLGPHYPQPGPDAGFFLWLPVGEDERFAKALWAESGVRVLPGRYLGAAGRGYVRLALVHAPAITERALMAVARRLEALTGG